MKVYIVTSGSYSDYKVEKVFLNREKAELYLKYHQSSVWDDYRVEEYEAADDYEPKDTYYYCNAIFEIKNEKDFLHKDGFYRTVFLDYKCCLIEKEHNYDCNDSTYYYSQDNRLRITRFFREKDYKNREVELQEKMQKIGFDLCAQITQMLIDGADEYDIDSMLRGK